MIRASLVGAVTSRPTGRHRRSLCARCGIERATKADTGALCLSCLETCAELGEIHLWSDQADPGTCAAGHPWTPANTAVRANGRRDCRACKAERERRRRARQRRDEEAA